METQTLPRAAALALARYANGEIDYWKARRAAGIPYGSWLELVLEAGLPGPELPFDEADEAYLRSRAAGTSEP